MLWLREMTQMTRTRGTFRGKFSVSIQFRLRLSRRCRAGFVLRIGLKDAFRLRNGLKDAFRFGLGSRMHLGLGLG